MCLYHRKVILKRTVKHYTTYQQLIIGYGVRRKNSLLIDSMLKQQYPTGVECHSGSLRIWFMLDGKRCRESLGIPDTPKNRKLASGMRQAITYEIKTGTFNYSERFPQSKKVSVINKSALTVGELFSKYLQIKTPEIASSTLNRYTYKLETCALILGKNTLVSTITSENLLLLRNELLTGIQRPANNHKQVCYGRTVTTVNDYVSTAKSVFKFAFLNGYITKNINLSVSKLKKSRKKPDPLLREEFARFIKACRTDQDVNLWIVELYTGIRPGELCALAWEDVDLVAGTVTIRRNWTAANQYTLPKTEASTDRVIYLLQPAIEAFKRQKLLTRLAKQHEIVVHLREYGETRIDHCTFVFSPSINAKHGRINERYSLTAINASWTRILKRAQIRDRKAYQSRHTFACWLLSSGANPSFIASQMGHSSAKMIYEVYGDWIQEHSSDQVTLLNEKLHNNFAPCMPLMVNNS